MTIRVRLTEDDLRHVTLSAKPSPIDGAILSAGWISRRWRHDDALRRSRRVDATRPHVDKVDRQLARLSVELLSPTGRPGFIDFYATTIDEALDHLMSATRQEVAGDLRQLASRGLDLPRWTADLARGDRQVRVELTASLRYLYDVAVADQLATMLPVADVAYHDRLQILATRGLDQLLDHLHPRLRWRPPRTVELITQDPAIDFDYDSSGTGLVLVPSPWAHSTPSLLLPTGSDRRPVLLFYPIGADASQAERPDDGQRIAELLGATRARVLMCIQAGAGLSTQELARAAGISIASASEHAAVLRKNRIVTGTRVGHRTVHVITYLGRQLLSSSPIQR